MGHSELGGHSDLGCDSNLGQLFRVRGVIQIQGSHSDGRSYLQGSFRFSRVFHVWGGSSVVEGKCLSAWGIKTILSEAKFQK